MKTVKKSLALVLSSLGVLSMFTACTDDTAQSSESINESSKDISSSVITYSDDIESEIEVEVDENAGGKENAVGYDVIIE